MSDRRPRPVFLNPFKIHQPVTAVVSIVHRLTGVVLVLMLPVALYALERSLANAEDFHRVSAYVSSPWGKLGMLLLVWLFAQHFFSGVRHLLLDMDIGIQRPLARTSAWLVWVASGLTVAIIALGLI